MDILDGDLEVVNDFCDKLGGEGCFLLVVCCGSFNCSREGFDGRLVRRSIGGGEGGIGREGNSTESWRISWIRFQGLSQFQFLHFSLLGAVFFNNRVIVCFSF